MSETIRAACKDTAGGWERPASHVAGHRRKTGRTRDLRKRHARGRKPQPPGPCGQQPPMGQAAGPEQHGAWGAHPRAVENPNLTSDSPKT